MKATGLVLAFALALPVQAQVDDLEDIGPDGTPVTSRTVGGVQITITTTFAQYPLTARTYGNPDPDFSAFVGSNSNTNGPLNPGNVSGSRFMATPADIDDNGVSDPGSTFEDAEPILFDFSVPVAGFGLTTVDLLESNAPGGANLTLRALDGNGQVVDEVTLFGPQGPSGLDLYWFVSSSSPDITRAVLTGSAFAGSCGHGIDDLVVQLCAVDLPSLQAIRVGVPPNPAALLATPTSPPVLGGTWRPRIDHTTFQPGAVLDVLAMGFATNVPSGFGTVLCFPVVASFLSPPSVPFEIVIPPDCSLVGGVLPCQGVSWDGTTIALTNAIDITLGTS